MTAPPAFAWTRALPALAVALLLSTGAQAGPAKGEAARLYEDALTRYEAHDVNGAIVQLKNALQLDRHMLSVHVLLGKALLASGQAAAAQVAFNEALDMGVDRAEVVVPLAQATLALGQQMQLLQQPTFEPAGLPRGVQAQVLLARAAAAGDLGNTAEALRTIEQARALDKRSPQSWLAEVPLRLRARQFDEAEAAARKARELAPASADAWYQLGTVAHLRGQLDAALEAYSKAVTLDGEHVQARVSRAGLLVDLRRYDEAAHDVAELRRLSPREPRAAYLRALIAEHRGDRASAQASLREVTALLDPAPPALLRYRPQLQMLNGLAHYGLGEREKAKASLEAFRKARRNSPTSKLLAQLHLADGHPVEAANALEDYLAAQPGDPQAALLLAAAHMAMGHHAQATSLIQEALRGGDAPPLRTALGLSLLGGGQTVDGVAELERAYKRDPGQTQAASALVAVYLGTGQTAKALAIAQALVQRRPDHASFHNLLGLAQAQAGQAAAARTAFERSAALDPGQVAPRLNLARLDMAAHAWDAAARRLQALLGQDAKNVDALLEMATLSQRRGQPDAALQWLEKANDVAGPHEARPGLALVALHLQQGRAPAALEAAKRLQAKVPGSVPVLLAHARAMLANNDVPGARGTLTDAMQLAGYDAGLQLQVARLQIRAGDLSGAAYGLDKALSSRPDAVEVLALRADVDTLRGDYAAAEQRARQIVKHAPGLALGPSLQGNIAMARGQRAEAVAAYRRAHKLQPSTRTLLQWVRALFAQDQGATALPLAEQWLKTHPRDLAVRKALADGHASLGQYAAARSAYEAALKIEPGDAEALNNLANVLLRLKDPAAALRVAEQALAQRPEDPVVIDTVAWAAHLDGQGVRALRLLRDARLRAPDNAEIRYHLASVLAGNGRRDEARAELVAALGQAGPFESEPEARALLESLQ